MKQAALWLSVCLLALVSVSGLGAQEVAAEPETPSKAGPLAQPAPASPVRLLRFSGAVNDTLGQPRTGVVGVTFALYAEPEGGAPLWLETQNVQLDEQGRYTALLGVTSNDGLPLELFSTEEARWLGIQVQGEAEHARVLLVSVPYALKAADAERLGGQPLSAFVRSDASGTATTSDGEVPIDDPKTQVRGNGTNNFVTKWTAFEFLGDSQIFDNGTNIGIGTTSPTNKLQVNGNIRLVGQTTHQVQVTGAASSGRLGQDVNGFFFASDTPGKNIRFLTSSGALAEHMRITETGNVGIGTTSPADKLHVAGNARAAGVSLTAGGTAGTPALRFSADPNTGLFSPGADALALATNGAEQLRVAANGNVGIGTTNPTAKLQVAGNVTATSVTFPNATTQTSAPLWAVVNSDGSLARGSGVTSSQAFSGGSYEVIFSLNVTGCAYIATLGLSGSFGVASPGEIGVVGRSGNANGVFISTRDSTGSGAAAGFHLLVMC